MEYMTDAREIIARRAEDDGEMKFAREVRAGAWDHRNDVREVCRKLYAGAKFSDFLRD